MHALKATVLGGLMLAGVVFGANGTASAEGVLGVPLDCEPGQTCFLQQYPDMASGPTSVDPFCRSATYNGHKGTDIRIPAMSDIAKNVSILALKKGRVLRVRDGEEDKPVLDPSEWPKFQGKDCGNGAIIDHGGGIEAQYCHMRKGSLKVKPGDIVEGGEPIGSVGASGMAAFPHLHVSVRESGVDVDPFTGRAIGTGCLEGEKKRPLWSKDALAFFDRAAVHVMAAGLSGAPPVYHRLMLDGPPPNLTDESEATIGWGWFLNLQKGDRMHFRVTAPDGRALVDTLTKPLNHSKAAYMQYAGRKRSPMPGEWKMTVDLMRAGKAVETKSARAVVE